MDHNQSDMNFHLLCFRFRNRINFSQDRSGETYYVSWTVITVHWLLIHTINGSHTVLLSSITPHLITCCLMMPLLQKCLVSLKTVTIYKLVFWINGSFIVWWQKKFCIIIAHIPGTTDFQVFATCTCHFL